MEPAATPGGVLIAQNTYDALAGEFTTRSVDPITAKGFDKPVPVYEVEF